MSQESLEKPSEYYFQETELVSTTGDFNDDDDSVYPGAPETCGDGIDQDCNGSDLVCSGSEWVLQNATKLDNGIIELTSVRNLTDWAYQTFVWDGKSDATISVDVKAVTNIAYAEYLKFGVFPQNYPVDWNLKDELYAFIQFGYSDGGSSKKVCAGVEGYSSLGANPIVGQWYTYTFDYNYADKELIIRFIDSDKTTFWEHTYSDVLFDFSTSNRVIGFFSKGMDSNYSNPSEIFQIKNLTIDTAPDI